MNQSAPNPVPNITQFVIMLSQSVKQQEMGMSYRKKHVSSIFLQSAPITNRPEGLFKILGVTERRNAIVLLMINVNNTCKYNCGRLETC